MSMHVRLALIYAFLYAGGGFVGIFMPLLFQGMGLSSLQIGIIAASSPVAAMVGAVGLGLLSDAFRARRKLIICCSLLCSWSLYLLLPFVGLYITADAFPISLSCIMLAAAIGVAAGSLLDAIAVESVPQNEYGRLRLWGAVGYGVASLFAGVIMVVLNPKTTWVLYLGHFAPNVATNIVAFIMILCLPRGSATLDEGRSDVETRPINDGDTVSAPAAGAKSDAEDARLLSGGSKPAPARLTSADLVDFIVFLVVVFLCGCAMGIVNTFLFIFIGDSLGGSQLIMGLSVTVTTAFEIPVFFFSTNILNNVHPDWTLALSLAAYCARWLCYWLYSVYRPNAWFILIPETFHGLTFALMWASIVAKAQVHIKSGALKSGLAMGICNAVKGLGGAAGSFSSGFALRDAVPIEQVWRTSFFVLCGIFGLWSALSALKNVLRCRAAAGAKSAPTN